jgi:hypothetical protein
MINKFAAESFIQELLSLREHYKQQIVQSRSKSAYYKNLLSSTNALIVGLPDITATSAGESEKNAIPAKKTSKSTSRRASLSLLPKHQGKSKLDAITSVLEENQGQVVYEDAIIRELYGKLSPEAFRKERVRMRAALYSGVRQKRWQKANIPSGYFLGTPQKSVRGKTNQVPSVQHIRGNKRVGNRPTASSTTQAVLGKIRLGSGLKSLPGDSTTDAPPPKKNKKRKASRV